MRKELQLRQEKYEICFVLQKGFDSLLAVWDSITYLQSAGFIVSQVDEIRNGNQPAASELDEKIREKRAENVSSMVGTTANSIPASLNKCDPKAFTPPPQSKIPTPKPISEALELEKEKRNVENKSLQAQESTSKPNPPQTAPEVQKTQGSPKGSLIPRKRNESPAFKMASDEIKGYLAKVTVTDKIKEEMLYEASHDAYDGDFLTLLDVEDGVGKLHVYQRAASGLRQQMKEVNPSGLLITDKDLPMFESDKEVF